MLRRVRVKTLDDPSAREIVGRELDGHPVSRKDPNAMDTHPSRNMGKNLVSPFRLDTERGVGEIFLHDPD